MRASRVNRRKCTSIDRDRAPAEIPIWSSALRADSLVSCRSGLCSRYPRFFLNGSAGRFGSNSASPESQAMDSSQKRNRDRKNRQRREDKAVRRKERSEQKLQRRTIPEGVPGTPGELEPRAEPSDPPASSPS